MYRYFGICLGASSISYVELQKSIDENIFISKSGSIQHFGKPRAVVDSLISKYNLASANVVFTGRKLLKNINHSSIPEPLATEYAYRFSFDNYEHSGITTLGGETFLLYTLDKEGRISDVIAKNQCASGTGEFYLQQLKRMNLTLEDSQEISQNSAPFKVSGRCSVFCKSDCTHALNKGVPKGEVNSGLALMIADKIEELVNKNGKGKIVAIGGVTNNKLVMDFLKSKGIDFVIPKVADQFEALGAALHSIEFGYPINDHDKIYIENLSSFSYHPSLESGKNKVIFKEWNKQNDIKLSEHEFVLGLDVGSTTTKAVIIDLTESRIIAKTYLYTNGDPIAASRNCYKNLIEQVGDDLNLIGIGTTGSGRQISALHAMTEGVVNEIIAHATAAVHFDNQVDTIFEIGGQDAKYTYIINGVPADYAMNEACSAGTGSFIEESASESLGISVRDIQEIAFKAINPPNFSDQCAAFISSDIKTAQQENIPNHEIVGGLVYSICQNYVNRVIGNRTIGNKVFMQGGVCYNQAIPTAMAVLTNKEIIVPPDPGLMGAYGVALVIRQKILTNQLKKGNYKLSELAFREVIYKKPFECLGGKEKCDRNCTINIIEVKGKKFPFGGACNKYYNHKTELKFSTDKFDIVKKRHRLLFKDYYESNYIIGAKSIGINLSFNTQTIFPLFYNFFRELGFNIILPDNVDQQGIDLETTSYCYPAQLSLGLFHNLLNKQPDYLFVPAIYEMFTEDNEPQRLDFNCSCVFVSGEPFYLKQTFKNLIDKGKIIDSSLNFSTGYGTQLKQFIQIANQLGVFDNVIISKAYQNAVNKQSYFEEQLKQIGHDILEYLSNNPDEFGIVIFGRPYNAFADFANKNIPRKFASFGVFAIPYDVFDFGNMKSPKDMFWEGGKKILKAASFIKDNNQLFATYITNFSCGPDSMIMHSFREIMGTKPSLTLELDGHTADAGINTRIEAALDIIRNYKSISGNIMSEERLNYSQAYIDYQKDINFFVKSDGSKIPLNDKSVKILIPSMGDLNSRMFAAALRSLGFNAESLPPSNAKIIKYGRENASGKECLPLLILAGSLVDYVENRWDGKENLAFFNVQGAGNCRLGQYPVFLSRLINNKKLENVALMVLMNEDGFAGFGSKFAMRGIQAIMIGDVLDDIRSAIIANSVDPESGLIIFEEEFKILSQSFEQHPDNIHQHLLKFAKTIKNKIPCRVPIENSKFIALLGEIYVRRDGFSHKHLNKKLGKQGFVVKSAHITEWIMYVDYLLKIDLLEPDKSLKNKVEREIRNYFMRQQEKKIKRILEKSGYYKFNKTEIKPLLDHSKHIIPLEFKGEPGLTLGTAMHESLEKYCGIINVGPFGCLPTRFTEAVSVPEMKSQNKFEIKQKLNPSAHISTAFNGHTTIPFLTIEVDGNTFPQVVEAKLEAFAMQANRISEVMSLQKK